MDLQHKRSPASLPGVSQDASGGAPGVSSAAVNTGRLGGTGADFSKASGHAVVSAGDTSAFGSKQATASG